MTLQKYTISFTWQSTYTFIPNFILLSIQLVLQRMYHLNDV